MGIICCARPRLVRGPENNGTEKLCTFVRPEKGCDFHIWTNPSSRRRRRPRKTKADTVKTYGLKFGHKPLLGLDTMMNGWAVAK